MVITKRPNLRVLSNKEKKALAYNVPQCNKIRKKEY